MLPVETFLELIERVEKAMRPLSDTQPSSDRERVRELYAQMLMEAQDDPLEQARLSALHEILQPYLADLEHSTVQRNSAIVFNVKAAIGALVVLLCHLDERRLPAAESSLHAAREMLQETQELLKSLRNNIAHA